MVSREELFRRQKKRPLATFDRVVSLQLSQLPACSFKLDCFRQMFGFYIPTEQNAFVLPDPIQI